MRLALAVTCELNPELLAISKIAPISVWDNREGGGTWVLPSLSHREAFPTLWSVLHLICSDWSRAAAESSLSNGQEEDAARAFAQFEAFERLKPRFIQCLFSYINFFFLLENGFNVFLSELGKINRELGVGLQLPRRPKRTEYIQKLQRVRNYTVVHWGGPEDKDKLDSRAGRFWGFSWPSEATDLTALAFGSVSVVGASDRVLLPIPDTHRVCIAYLKEYDEKCADLFARIVTHLPITIGTRTYRQILTTGDADGTD